MYQVICEEYEMASRMGYPGETTKKILYKGSKENALAIFEDLNAAKKRLKKIAKVSNFGITSETEMVHGFEVSYVTSIYLEAV